jgi:hypothetical protein
MSPPTPDQWPPAAAGQGGPDESFPWLSRCVQMQGPNQVEAHVWEGWEVEAWRWEEWRRDGESRCGDIRIWDEKSRSCVPHGNFGEETLSGHNLFFFLLWSLNVCGPYDGMEKCGIGLVRLFAFDRTAIVSVYQKRNYATQDLARFWFAPIFHQIAGFLSGNIPGWSTCTRFHKFLEKLLFESLKKLKYFFMYILCWYLIV